MKLWKLLVESVGLAGARTALASSLADGEPSGDDRDASSRGAIALASGTGTRMPEALERAIVDTPGALGAREAGASAPHALTLATAANAIGSATTRA